MKKYTLPILFALLMTPLALQFTPLEILKLKTFDTFVAKQEPTGNFVILDINEKDIEKEEDSGPNKVTNNLFVGSTADLQKIINPRKVIDG